ncbi:hypothetical protein M413DRAFT_438410 [Hebeloma cylindrosporum]|uniref:Phosphatidylinositol N-acetylglucosaminyltransferase subunit H conserved domain-containing protein n=1 Tax=Hebeloma cylindrosporum TaxID=76867 RepID=A0A0C3CKK8_HEBCY|nr:hypothetical protein M413DRAFT_438410 [Hebeloma cylindrosporum h7]
MDLLYRLLFHRWIIEHWLPNCTHPLSLSRTLYSRSQKKYYYPILAVFLLVVLGSSAFQVLFESVILLPPHGIQLDTHRGPFPSQPVFSIKRFIPVSNLSGIAINEGLRGWNVLFYLVALQHTRRGTVLEVAYKDLLPVQSILLQVFEGIHELLLRSPTQNNEDVH